MWPLVFCDVHCGDISIAIDQLKIQCALIIIIVTKDPRTVPNVRQRVEPFTRPIFKSSPFPRPFQLTCNFPRDIPRCACFLHKLKTISLVIRRHLTNALHWISGRVAGSCSVARLQAWQGPEPPLKPSHGIGQCMAAPVSEECPRPHGLPLEPGSLGTSA